MKILHRLPGFGWNPDVTITIEELWGDSLPRYYTFVVGTVDEFDYLKAMGIMMGRELKVAYDPSFSVLKTNAVELLIIMEPKE